MPLRPTLWSPSLCGSAGYKMCTQAVSLPQVLQAPCQAESALLTMVREASFRARAAFTPLLIFSYMQRETSTC